MGKIFIGKYIVFFSLISFIGCATLRPRRYPKVTVKRQQKRDKVVMTARSMLGKKAIVVGKKRYKYDCSNFVRAVYIKSLEDCDLYRASKASPKASGVELIYYYCQKRGKIYKGLKPEKADLIFFRNTYDRNKNGIANDKFTHVGIVEKVKRKGTITFIHLGSKGIIRSKMNLRYPHLHKRKGEIYNDYLRRKDKSDHKKTKYLTGELFQRFGSVIK